MSERTLPFFVIDSPSKVYDGQYLSIDLSIHRSIPPPITIENLSGNNNLSLTD